MNPTRQAHTVKVSLAGSFQRVTDLWLQTSNPTVAGNTVTVAVEDRNAAVLRLE